jgi:hypothetical protein
LLPAERHEWDEENSVMLSNIIYSFDNNSNFIGSLGQDGTDGTPFPVIKNIETNNNNEIIVITITPAKYIIYWFTEKRKLLYKIELDQNAIPSLSSGIASSNISGSENYFTSMENIKVPDKGYYLYIETKYYEKKTNISGIESNSDFYKSYINVLDVRTSNYINMIEIPDVYTVSNVQSNFAEKPLQVVYNFLDIINNKHIFLYARINDTTLQILVIDDEGRVEEQTRININFENYFYLNVDLSDTGIISALLAGNNDASVRWWRTDSIIKGK